MRNESHPHFVIISYGSNDYRALVALRESVLRAPLGLSFTPEELAQERDHVHVGGFLGDELVATCVLVPEGDVLKMQRVAVTPSRHGKGVGSLLAAFCEAYAKGEATARCTATPGKLLSRFI